MTIHLIDRGRNSAIFPATAVPVTLAEAPEQSNKPNETGISEDTERVGRQRERPSDRWESDARLTEVETRISVDGATHQIVVQVVDAHTEETIREVPPEKIRAMAEYLSQFLGHRVDERA